MAEKKGKEEEGVIKQGSIASFMRKRTQLVGFDTGHFKHVQYAVEFLDNALDAIESFHWKNQNTEKGYQLESEIFQDWVTMEDEMMEANTMEAEGLSPELSAVFTSMGEGNGEVSAVEEPVSVSTSQPIERSKTKSKSKLSQKTDIDLKINSIVTSMENLINPYVNLAISEPIVIIRLTETEDKSLVFLEEAKKQKLYCFEIFDSGTGLNYSDLEKFGMYLASSKSEKLKQTRGSQGFGSPSAFSDAQNTTGKPIQVVSKSYKSEEGYVSEFFTTGENKKSYTVEPVAIDTDFYHGTYIRLFYTNLKYVRGYVDSYVKQTALMNSHVNIIYTDPYHETHMYKRLVDEFPDEPKYAKPHPGSMNIGDFQDLLRTTEHSTLKQFLEHSFVRVSGNTASNIISNSENELQDRARFIQIDDNSYITIPEKIDENYVYLYREEKRVYGKSTRKRKKWVTYMMNVGHDTTVEAYKELYDKYEDVLKTISKKETEIKKLEKNHDNASTKKAQRAIRKDIRKVEKDRDKDLKTKEDLKKDFAKFIKNNLDDGFQEISKKKVEEVLAEKENLVTLSRVDPHDLQEIQVNTIYKYFTLEKYMSPPTDTAIPVGADILESVLIEEFGLNISKFDQYFFDEEEEKKNIENDLEKLPAMQKDFLDNYIDDVDEESGIYTLMNLKEDQFVVRMASVPIIRFTEIKRDVDEKSFKSVYNIEKGAYKIHSLFNEELVEEDLDFVGAVTRDPTSGKGLAFVVEAAIAFGNKIRAPAKASDVVYRFVNRTPKLRDNADCAIWKTISIVNWRNYKVDTFDNGIPKGTIRVFVNVSGPFVHLMFKSQSKQALAEDDNLTKEMKLALEHVGRKLRAYLSKRQKHADSKKRATKFIKFAPVLAQSIVNILSKEESEDELVKPEVLTDKIIEGIGKKTPLDKAPSLIEGERDSKIIDKDKVKTKPKPKKKPQPEPEEEKEEEKKEMKEPVPSKTEKATTKSKKPTKKKIDKKSASSKKVEAPTQKTLTAKGPVKITEDNILKYLPDGKYVKISYMIKALNIKDITDARFLEIKLKTLVRSGRLEKITQEGKSYYKKK